MNYINLTDINYFGKENLNFITIYYKRKKNKVGKPLTLPDGNIYYPIYYPLLFLRYFISNSCCIYDIVTKEIKKYTINDIIELETISMNDSIKISIAELYSNTFFRYKDGLNLKWNNLFPNKVELSFYKENNIDSYNLYGTEYRRVMFSKNSFYYNEFIIKDKCKLIISKEGSIINLTTKKFVRIESDLDGNLYIKSKSGVKLNLLSAFIYSDWFYNDYSKNKDVNVAIVAPTKYQLSLNNILIFNYKDLSLYPVESQLIVKYIINPNKDNYKTFHSNKFSRNNKKSEFLKLNLYEAQRIFGKFYTIPIQGLNNYGVSKSGVIYSFKLNAILTPYKISKKNLGNSLTYDILYEFKNANLLMSISEILMWTFYRLTLDTISYHNCIIRLNNYYDIPVIDSLTLISKPIITDNEISQIGESYFIEAYNYPSYSISNTGSILDIKENTFVEIHSTTTTPTFRILLPKGKYQKWVDPAKLMYRTWIYKRIPKNFIFNYRNGIKEDYSITNISLSLSTGYIENKVPDQEELIDVNYLIQRYKNKEMYMNLSK